MQGIIANTKMIIAQLTRFEKKTCSQLGFYLVYKIESRL